MRVLIVDDAPTMRRLLRRWLEKYDHVIVGELSDGYTAAVEVEESNPDLVIMDSAMPIVRGADATREVKRRFPHMPVLGFTSADGEARAELLEAGAEATFLKSDMPALLEYIQQLDRR